MKKQLLIIMVFALFGLSAKAQNTNPTLNGTFVQGISPVNNTFVFTDPNGTATQADFYSVDGVSGNAVFISTDNTPIGGAFTSSTVDMGSLSPQSYIRVDVTDGTAGNYSDSSEILIIIVFALTFRLIRISPSFPEGIDWIAFLIRLEKIPLRCSLSAKTKAL